MEVTNSKICQLQVVYEAGGPLTVGDYVRSSFLRMNRAIRRRLLRHFANMDAICEETASVINKMANASCRSESLTAGDLVEVRSIEEIRQTLDQNGRCGGLQFMAGMERFAGQRFLVLKKVRTIFDERAWKMVGVRDAVLLKDVICDGRDMYDKEGCDRSCYFFWRTKWLKKIGEMSA